MNNDVEILPEIKQIIGSLLFASKEPLGIAQIKKAINETGNILDGVYKQYSKVNDQQIKDSIQLLENELASSTMGIELTKVAADIDFKIIFFAVLL